MKLLARRQPAVSVGACLAGGFAIARLGKFVAADVSRDDLPTMPEVGHGSIAATLAPGGRVLLVHWTGDTDYPNTGDGAVEALWESLQSSLRIESVERHDGFRLDLWDRP